MDKLRRGNQFRLVLELFFQPVFDCLDVMIGDRFNFLDACGVPFSEVGSQVVERLAGTCRKRGDFGQPGLCQGLEPGDFNLDPMMHKSRFRQDRAQLVGFRCIAAIERRQGGKRGKGHIGFEVVKKVMPSEGKAASIAAGKRNFTIGPLPQI
jgi:hypothetical protein